MSSPASANENIKVNIKLPAVSGNHSNKKAEKITIQFNRETKIQTVLDVLALSPETKYLTNIDLKHNNRVLTDTETLSGLISEKDDSIEFAIQLKPYTAREALKHVIVLRDFIGFISETDDSISEFAASTGPKFPFLPLTDIRDKNVESKDDVEEVVDINKDGKKEEEKKKNIFHVSDEEKAKTASLVREITSNVGDCSVKKLLAAETKLITPCVRSISLSQYNPVPAHYKSKGHLLYLQIATLENENFQITAVPSGFFINKCSSTKFDPERKPSDEHTHFHNDTHYSLFSLLAAHSKKFVSHVQQMESKLGKLEAVTYVKPQTSFLHKPWLISNNPNALVGDYFMLQSEANDGSVSFIRNFNDEFQAIKDLPTETLPAKIETERLLAKLIHEFSVAATKDAMSIMYNNLVPMNPDAPELEQIFLKDNIFYSFVNDVTGTYQDKGGDEAARIAVNQDLLTISMLNKNEITDVRYLLTTVIDLAGKRVLAQTPVPGLLTNMGVENIKNDATGESDMRDLESDIVIKYGLDETSQTVVKDEDFDNLLSKKFVKLFHLKKAGEKDVCFSSQSKGIIGSDKRSYIMDLANTYPLDVKFARENFDNVQDKSERYPHRQTLLRPELVEKWWMSKVDGTENLDYEKALEENKFSYNSDAYQTEGVEDAAVDEMSNYLVGTVLPNVLDDYLKDNVSPPYSGEHLVETLHNNGINLRYLGKFATLAKANLSEQIAEHKEKLKQIAISNKDYEDWEASYLIKIEKMIKERQEEINKYVEAGKDVPAALKENLKLDDNEIRKPTNEEPFVVNRDALVPLIKISEVEMIARATKHILRYHSKRIPVVAVTSLVAYVFNLLFGFEYNETPAVEFVDEFYPVDHYDFSKLTRESLVSSIVKEIRVRFRYELSEDDLKEHLNNRYMLMREISYRFGIQWLNKDYFFTLEEFETYKSSQDKKSKQKLVAPITTFSKEDLTIIPRIKTSKYSSKTSDNFWNNGTTLITEEKQSEGLTLMAQGIAILEDIQGGIHTDVARKYTSMASIYSKMGFLPESVAFCRKACTIYERTCGVDSFEMLRSLFNLALLEIANDSPYNATLICHRIMTTLNAYHVNKFHHPTITTIYNQLEQIALGLESPQLAIEVLTKLCEIVVEWDGKEVISYAYIESHLGNLYATLKDYRAALEHISYAKDVFFNELGSNHTTTASSKQWVNGLSNMIKDLHQKKMLQTAQNDVASGKPYQSKKNHHAKKEEKPNPELADKSVDELLSFIEGDEEKGSKNSKPKNKKKNSKK
ncbi:translation initiation factor 3 subunit CLU1 KNAG_0M02070 [Huiozyma naganishii CBS 8797]|uniref:Clu domain-containing protein n=1 Tax=Huiozyma naganishii (strain ATCC MYA-139 / BCRC 22969 / CBS 8797 / KCTC 17520 / NBRC 10181 / NCYC 3082 / Yp74L-3) TaxID=1071383 RepID=J7RDZ4_HUIN7|nr:hypothetical protein KNAG_0M02070 [Kazachstania naganishii CBS 8797]CCK73060.1 hypothetical protein KNAG_0M02070 [Kazachstania naganishii CBS 8797]